MTTKRQSLIGVHRRALKNKTPENRTQNRIPPYLSDPIQSITNRYYVPSGGSDIVAFVKELPIPPFGISYASNSVILPFKAVRLKKVQIWCMYRESKDIAGNTINLKFNDRRLVCPAEWSDTASYMYNAHIRKKFSKFEPLGQWYITTSGETNPELTFQLPQGAVLEITFDYILSDEQNCPSSADTVGAFPGVYTNRLVTTLSAIGKARETVLNL